VLNGRKRARGTGEKEERRSDMSKGGKGKEKLLPARRGARSRLCFRVRSKKGMGSKEKEGKVHFLRGGHF